MTSPASKSEGGCARAQKMAVRAWLRRGLLAATFVGLAAEGGALLGPRCEACKQAATDFLAEWAALEPTLLADLPAYVCTGKRLVTLCAQLVIQGLTWATGALNHTTPSELCAELRQCEPWVAS